MITQQQYQSLVERAVQMLKQAAIVSEFSPRSTDDQDLFTDPRIKRAPEVSKG